MLAMITVDAAADVTTAADLMMSMGGGSAAAVIKPSAVFSPTCANDNPFQIANSVRAASLSVSPTVDAMALNN